MKAAKALVAAIGTVLTVLVAALADDLVDASETATIISTVVVAALTVYGVWRVPNTP
jgi:hypothetical protein